MTAPQHCCRCQPWPGAERRSCATPDAADACQQRRAGAVEPWEWGLGASVLPGIEPLGGDRTLVCVEGLLEDRPVAGPSGAGLEGDDHPAVIGDGAVRMTVLEGHPHGVHARRHLAVFDPHTSEPLAVAEPGVAGAEGKRPAAAGDPVVGDRPARELHADDVGVPERGGDAAALRPVVASPRPEQHQSAGRSHAVDIAWGSEEGRAGPHSHDLTDVPAQPWVGRRAGRAGERACGCRDERHAHDRDQYPEQSGTHTKMLTMPLTTRKRPTIASAPTASLEAFSRSQTLKRAVACAVQAGATR